MGENSPSDWAVSEEELATLTELFVRFEGASDPRCLPAREAEAQFNALLEQIYVEKVAPRFSSITRSQFRSYARLQCRLRVRGEGPPYPLFSTPIPTGLRNTAQGCEQRAT